MASVNNAVNTTVTGKQNAKLKKTILHTTDATRRNRNAPLINQCRSLIIVQSSQACYEWTLINKSDCTAVLDHDVSAYVFLT